MTAWMFKLADQTTYADLLGRLYVFDNTHSRKVAAGDSFAYLDKRGGSYSFIGHGHIARIRDRRPAPRERRNARVTSIYEAELSDFVDYVKPLDIRTRTRQGRRNRARLGIANVNRLGLSRSVAKLPGRLFQDIVDLAYEGEFVKPDDPLPGEFSVPDSWSYVRRRDRLEQFRRTVLQRQNYTCAICGTAIRDLLDVAHISGYSTDADNRANPANGVCLCVYCHRAFDRGLVRLGERGSLELASNVMRDTVAKVHFTRLSTDSRRRLLRGVDADLLLRRDRQAEAIDYIET